MSLSVKLLNILFPFLLKSISRDGFQKLMVGCSLMFFITFLLFAALKNELIEKEPGKGTKEEEVGGDYDIEQ